jgi:hypothetical protein
MPGIDIDVVSDGPDDTGSDGDDGVGGRQPALFLSMLRGIRLSLPDAIVARSVSHMTREILARLRRDGVREIHRLRIYGHGVPGEVWIGSGRLRPAVDQVLGVDDRGLLRNSADLEYVRGRFAADGFVTVHGCNYAAGKRGRSALHGLSSIWSVRVSASAAAQVAQQSGAQFVTTLQPPVLTAADLSRNPTPVTPLANSLNPPETPVAATWR